ncbi:hypothetical protein KGO06_01200 [Patescibacteria group bacterium]|nr:hypothetical protein [Patescibacteria group bacterium]
MSPEAFSAGSHLFTTLAASLGLDFEQLQELQNTDGFDALFDGQGGGSFSQVAYSTEQEFRDLTRLRQDPVADAVGDKTVLEDAYDGSRPDMDPGKDPSKIMQAARAIADKGSFSPEKREAFLQYIQDNRDSMKSATIGNGEVILMADGARSGYNANLFRTNLPEDQRDVLTGTFTYTEGNVKKTETVYIFKDCGNPAVHAAPDAEVPPPAPPCDDSVTRETSNAGIDFDGQDPEKPVHMYTAIRVTGIDTEYIDTGKLGELDKRIQSLIKSGELQLMEGKNQFLLFADKSCDGVDEVYCVTITKNSDGITYTLSDFLTESGKKFSELSEAEQKEWMRKR